MREVIAVPAPKDGVLPDIEQLRDGEFFEVAIGKDDIEAAAVAASGVTEPMNLLGISLNWREANFGPERLRFDGNW